MNISLFLTQFCCIFNTFLSWKIFLISCLCYYFLYRRGNKNSDVLFRRIRPLSCPSKNRENAVYKERNGRKVFLSRQSRHISLVIIMIKVLFPTLYLHLACKQLCFLPSKSIYRKTKVLLLLYNFVAFGTVLVSLKTLTVCFD